ncbi:MAG: adenylate/guanylate cyclase domain-containing protein [Chloroflexota bacterium]|nr:adenylate/guanylate cyclase domain-containing protein [Chloroflexota bacterium]
MRRSALVAWIVCALALALLASGAAVEIATWSVSLPPGLIPRGLVLSFAPVYAILGAVIVRRVPTNAIGYLFLYASLFGAAQLLSEQTAFAAEVWPALAPVAPWAGLTYVVLGFVLGFGLTPYLIALFPSGRFATVRDRWAVVIGTVAFLLLLVALVIGLERPPAPFAKYANPLAQPELGAVRTVMAILSMSVFVLALVAVLLGLTQRFRRSTGVDRQQLKWFAYAGAIQGITAAVVSGAFQIAYTTRGQAVLDEPPVELRALVLLAIGPFVFLPLAVTLAILRNRLYDIDILINRTVLYVSVTAILAAVFAVLSAVSERAVEALTGERSDLVTIGLVLVVALGFAPLRRRVQPFVDQLLPGRGLLTLLFTDIVGSTERVVALGDERWRTLLEAYRAAVRRELARFGGREIDTAGDGFFATFERPTQAVRSAVALRDSLQALGLDSRVGLHMGECELRVSG